MGRGQELYVIGGFVGEALLIAAIVYAVYYVGDMLLNPVTPGVTSSVISSEPRMFMPSYRRAYRRTPAYRRKPAYRKARFVVQPAYRRR